MSWPDSIAVGRSGAPALAAPEVLATETLNANQSTPIGSVIVSRDGDNLFVEFSLTASGWTMSTTYLWLGTDLSTFPKGPGKYTYKHYLNPPGTYDKFGPVSLSSVLGLTKCGTFYVAAHAAVQQNGGSQVSASAGSAGNWPNKYFPVTVACQTPTATPTRTP
ncbi:MAG: hypothetical protein C4289_17080, partial [Chloroflexota bacterium]